MTVFGDLKGLTLAAVEGSEGAEEVVFVVSDGRRFVSYHEQDCCEDVHVSEIIGDLNDLVGAPLLIADEVQYDRDVAPEGCPRGYDRFTWTFYKLATIKGHVTIRWLGESNGYYSESVNLRVE